MRGRTGDAWNTATVEPDKAASSAHGLCGDGAAVGIGSW
jgi:hypothetical protein